MSEIGLNINVDSYNNEGIKTIKGNNNAEIYKLYILKNKRRLSLVGKTVKLGYVMVGTTNGDVIENLNITNAEQGEITFPITNRISKKDGVYSCQLAIYGADGFLEHTATFGLTVEANIFTKIAGEIADSKDFTYLENILDKASKLSEKLKENTSSATNANSNLESNITEANNINSKLLENTSTATSLNKNLESNIDLAKEVKETIKDLDTKNIEATEKIETLTGLNAKAEELSNNINEALPVKDALVKNIEEAKVANTNLVATNNDAKAKKTDLDNSLEEAKKYISGLDGSKNPVQMQLDINELKNGLKSNQSLSYEGSSIAANNTLEGRTEGMRIVGRTLQNVAKKVEIRRTLESVGVEYSIIPIIAKNNTEYTLVLDVTKNTTSKNADYWGIYLDSAVTQDSIVSGSITTGLTKGGFTGRYIFKFRSKDVGSITNMGIGMHNDYSETYEFEATAMLLEGDWTNKPIPQYFEGIKSLGEQEGNKISILSRTSNLFNKNTTKNYVDETGESVNPEYISSDFIEVEENMNYIRSDTKTRGNIAYDKDKRVIGNITTGNNILTPKNCKYIRFNINKSINTNTIIFAKGNILPPYQPYQLDKKDILIKEPLKEREYIYEDNGQVKVCRKSYEYTLNGENEDWIVWTNSTGDTVNAYVYFNRMTPNLSGIIKPNSSNINDRLPANQGGYLSTKEGFKVTAEYFALSVHKSKLGVTDVNDPNNSTLIKKWLKENPITMICQLATPTVEIVENCVDIDLDTFGEKTYFNILNSLPGTLDFKVPSNIGSVVQNMAKEVNNIWDVINNLLVPGILDVNKKVALATIKNNLK
ncbi:BppU family phage baseplate upper protein [Clostridium perfringens]|nr:BppU family phage baseplate upper protein [Clostridium perfringens]